MRRKRVEERQVCDVLSSWLTVWPIDVMPLYDQCKQTRTQKFNLYNVDSSQD